MIHYYSRKTKTLETEQIYGDRFIALAYENNLAYFLTDHFFSKYWFSKIFGIIESSKMSSLRIPTFVKKFNIDMSEYEEKTFESFNDFFIRKFRPGLRNFSNDPADFCAGAEGRYLGFENISDHHEFSVKGIQINLTELLGDATLASEFDEGTMIIARLCPVDYHRFHFPVEAKVLFTRTISGALHSVNPIALTKKKDIFFRNERQIAVFENDQFGKVAMIEVGALGVGKIIQSAYNKSSVFPIKFEKGHEKGYFLFGGSTVLWLLKKGSIALSSDLVENSNKGIETWVALGDSLGDSLRTVKSTNRELNPH